VLGMDGPAGGVVQARRSAAFSEAAQHRWVRRLRRSSGERERRRERVRGVRERARVGRGRELGWPTYRAREGRGDGAGEEVVGGHQRP
jgi:hypothetical protein